MARDIPTQKPPEFPDEELVPDEPAPGGRELLRMFLPVAAAIVVFITALMLALKFLVIPAMERSDPAVQARALATIGALQTQEAVTRSQQALTPQTTTTPQPLGTAERPEATAQPVTQPTVAPTVVGVSVATGNQAPTAPATATAATAPTIAPSSATPVQPDIDTGNVPAQPGTGSVAAPIPTVDPVAEAEVQQAYAHYWTQRTLAFRDLDTSLLDAVAAGAELDALTSGIDDLRSQGRAVRTHVIHHVVALPTAHGEAVVADEYQDLSIYLDFETKAPVDASNPDPQTGPTVKVRKLLQKLGGVWKVTASERYD
jgi:hypothetical protein